MRQLPLGVRLRDRASFASFVAGGNSEAVRHVTELAGGERSGCAWIHGPAGCGKTHLLQAACARAAGNARAGYVPLADFAQGESTVLDGWRDLDCLCVDDLQFVAGRRSWDEVLFRLYRDFEERGARLIVAANEPPGALGWSLFSFNVGVEIGQVCIVVVAASLLMVLRRRNPALAGRVATVGSVVVILAGSYWFIQRVFF